MNNAFKIEINVMCSDTDNEINKVRVESKSKLVQCILTLLMNKNIEVKHPYFLQRHKSNELIILTFYHD